MIVLPTSTHRCVLLLTLLLILSCAAVSVEYRGKGGEEVFGLTPAQTARDYTAQEIDCGGRSNVFVAGDALDFTVQFANTSNSQITAQGRAEIIAYSTTHEVGNMWWGQVLQRGGLVASIPFSVSMLAAGFTDVHLSAPAPRHFGGFALVVDLPDHGRQFVAAFVYVPKPTPGKVQFPSFAMDIRNVTPESCTLWQRLGLKATRLEIGYTPTTRPDFPQRLAQMDGMCALMAAHDITPLLTLEGGDTSTMPMGCWRSFLNDQAEGPMTYMGDAAWEPRYDADFTTWVALLAGRYGWPKGPVNAVELWNEPWDGQSISGWGADIPRFREIYTAMAQGVEMARARDHTQVLMGGCCSSLNTEEKLFSDGTEAFLPRLDFTSIHYQPLDTIPALIPAWRERKSPYGPVRPWDTETWMANCDDRVSAVLASMRATGLERTAGVFHDMVFNPTEVTVRTAGGTKRTNVIQVWSTAAAVAANQALLGERVFKEILFRNGLPWIFVFNGLNGDPDDGVVVVIGDLGAAYGRTQTLFRTVLGRSNAPVVARLRTELAALPSNASREQRDKLQWAIDEAEVLTDGRLILNNERAVQLFDIYGNRQSAHKGKLTIPLDGKGYYLRTDHSRGSFARLLAALRRARIDGYQPVEILARDMLASIEQHPAVRIQLTNILNRPITGTLTTTCGVLKLDIPVQRVTLAPHETRLVMPHIIGGVETADNTYPLTAAFDGGKDGVAALHEDLHCNIIVRRAITIDGKWDDWQGIVPQSAHADAVPVLNPTEQAWFPFGEFPDSVHTGWSIAYLAYDDHNFYFSAKVADTTPNAGDIRFATRDDDQYFYPETSFRVEMDRDGKVIKREKLSWPEGVRRFSYRKWPQTPFSGWQGGYYDALQIAFNVLPPAQKALYEFPQGTMPHFMSGADTDYEYFLHAVNTQYGGGTELWRLLCPGMPRKHYFPREPKSPIDMGPVANGQLAIRQEGNTRLVECAIPWEEIPAVRQALDAGRPIKFAVRYCDDQGAIYYSSEKRSVARRNYLAFHGYEDWANWSNDVEFAFVE